MQMLKRFGDIDISHAFIFCWRYISVTGWLPFLADTIIYKREKNGRQETKTNRFTGNSKTRELLSVEMNGIHFTEEQEREIRRLVQIGDTSRAQKIIFDIGFFNQDSINDQLQRIDGED